MIFTTIWTKDNKIFDNLGKQFTAKVEEFNVAVAVSERTDYGRLTISGKGQHQKKDGLRETEESTKCEKIANPDFTDEFTIQMDREAVIRICKAALEKKLIKISDVIPEDLESEVYKVEDEFFAAYGNLKDLIEKLKS